MSSAHGAFACFCICLYYIAQAPAEGAMSRITSLKRIENGNNFTFIAEYETDSDVEALWDHTGMGVQTLEPGRVALVTQKGNAEGNQSAVTLRLGNFHSQYVRIDWNVLGGGNQYFYPLDYDMSTVNPGTTMIYMPHDTEKITVEVPTKRGNGFLRFDDVKVDVSGTYLNPKTNLPIYNSQIPSFITHQRQHRNDLAITTLIFHKPGIIDGWFPAKLQGYPTNATNTPIQRITEVLIFTVRQDLKPVSIPLGSKPIY